MTSKPVIQFQGSQGVSLCMGCLGKCFTGLFMQLSEHGLCAVPLSCSSPKSDALTSESEGCEAPTWSRRKELFQFP